MARRFVLLVALVGIFALTMPMFSLMAAFPVLVFIRSADLSFPIALTVATMELGITAVRDW